MNKITPCLWYDKEAKEASQFYVSCFGNGSKVKSTTVLENTPSGTVDIVSIELFGQEFTLISAGPFFKLNPSISFLVVCKTKEEVDRYWEKLSKNGSVLMELGKYPFSKRYGWVRDKFKLTWQLYLTTDHMVKQRIIPTLMFTDKQSGQAESAIKHYVSVFQNAKIGDILRYSKGEEPDTKGTIKHSDFMLEGQRFAAMDSARVHNFTFNEAISFIVQCKTQEEIDYYWNKLSANPEAEQCGWLKDKFGVSWQIVPTGMDKMLKGKTKEKTDKLVQTFLTMKKIDIATLQKLSKG
jgi:predicted 3-demethylubiquinone-9 3-methyltransferase (glyoxalase superfamily)